MWILHYALDENHSNSWDQHSWEHVRTCLKFVNMSNVCQV